MTLKELITYWQSDYQRYYQYGGKKLKILLFTPGFRYMFYVRLCNYLKKSKFHLLYIPLYITSRVMLKHYEFKYSIQIPYTTKIGYGLYIGHHGGIVINYASIIGDNVNISQSVTIGLARTGVPVIGDDVYLGAGAKVIGGVVIGNNVAIGANCVVTKNIPDNAVVVGIPCKIISYKGNKINTIMHK